MLAVFSSVLVEISSVLVENYVCCKSPTQIFPTKATPLVVLILFREKQILWVRVKFQITEMKYMSTKKWLQVNMKSTELTLSIDSSVTIVAVNDFYLYKLKLFNEQ